MAKKSKTAKVTKGTVDPTYLGIVRCLVSEIEILAITKYVNDSTVGTRCVEIMRDAITLPGDVRTPTATLVSGDCGDYFYECSDRSCVSDPRECKNNPDVSTSRRGK